MDYVLGLGGLLLLLLVILPLWAIVASPLLLIVVLLHRLLRKPIPLWKDGVFAAVAAFFLMPVPTPIISPVLYPLAYIVFNIPDEPPWDGRLPVGWSWLVPAYLITVCATFAITRFGQRWWRNRSRLGRRVVVTSAGVWSALSFAWIGMIVWMAV